MGDAFRIFKYCQTKESGVKMFLQKAYGVFKDERLMSLMSVFWVYGQFYEAFLGVDGERMAQGSALLYWLRSLGWHGH